MVWSLQQVGWASIEEEEEVLIVTMMWKNLIEPEYTIHGQPLKIVSSTKYLGLTVDSKMNYDEQISNISKKANSSRSFIHWTPEAVRGKSRQQPKLRSCDHSWSTLPQSGVPMQHTASVVSNQYNVVQHDL